MKFLRHMLGTGIEQTIKMQYFKVIVIKLVQNAKASWHPQNIPPSSCSDATAK